MDEEKQDINYLKNSTSWKAKVQSAPLTAGGFKTTTVLYLRLHLNNLYFFSFNHKQKKKAEPTVTSTDSLKCW